MQAAVWKLNNVTATWQRVQNGIQLGDTHADVKAAHVFRIAAVSILDMVPAAGLDAALASHTQLSRSCTAMREERSAPVASAWAE